VTVPGATANDSSSYCNPPAISIVKRTNGADANDPNGAGVPVIPAGATVTWTYTVTNTGATHIPRASVVVTDNVTGVTPTFSSEQSGNGDNTFDPGEVWIYQATGAAINVTNPPAGVVVVAGVCTQGGANPPSSAYTNVGTVTVPGATANDASSYCNPPGVSIVKFTNGADANNPDAAGVPLLKPGDPVTWTYRVANTGATHVPKASVVVTDNVTGVTPSFDSELSGNGDTTFDPGEVWQYRAVGIALDLTLPPPSGYFFVPGKCTEGGTRPPSTAYTNIGTATIPGATVNDASSYCSAKPGIAIIKYTNGVDANDPNGAGVPDIAAGSAVTWLYKVTNTGETSVAKANVFVSDNVTGVSPVFDSVLTGNADAVFDPGEVWQYKATGTALNLSVAPPAGAHFVNDVCSQGGSRPPATAYTNIGTATMTGATASDPSSYCNPPVPVPQCLPLSYPDTQTGRGSVVFNESTVLAQSRLLLGATKADTSVALWATDEHAPLLGVNKSPAPAVTPLAGNLNGIGPSGHAGPPLSVGDPAFTDPFKRPLYPAVFVTDITSGNHLQRDGDWQQLGASDPNNVNPTANQPSQIFGTWKAATATLTTNISSAGDPTKNKGACTAAVNGCNAVGSLGPGSDSPPATVSNLGYLTEVRWNVTDLKVSGGANVGQSLQSGHSYRVQFMVHDGDQNKTGGDVGEACLNVTIP